MCRHSLSVLAQERVTQVPPKYILVRWSKNIQRRHTYIRDSYDVAQMKPQMERFDKLCKHFYEVAEIATSSEDVSNAVHENLTQLKESVKLKTTPIYPIDKRQDHRDCSNADPHNVTMSIQSPLRVKRKGRPPSKRKISVVEKLSHKCKRRKKANHADKGLNVDVCLPLFVCSITC